MHLHCDVEGTKSSHTHQNGSEKYLKNLKQYY